MSGFDVREQATACGVHKVAGMVDLKHKRCEVVDCVRHRVYGVLGGKVRFWTRASISSPKSKHLVNGCVCKFVLHI